MYACVHVHVHLMLQVGDLLINLVFAGHDSTSIQLMQLINDLQSKPEVRTSWSSMPMGMGLLIQCFAM